MGWRDWHSWFKGGLIAGFVNLGIFLIVYIINTQIQNGMHYNWMKLDYYPYFGKILASLVLIPGILGLFLALFFLGIFLEVLKISFQSPSIYEGGGLGAFGGAFTPFGSFLIILISFIIYFLAGALIGFIYSKIKKENKNK